jgi:hypothetical protein
MKKSDNSLRVSNGPSSKRKSLNPTKEEEQQIAYNAELQRLVFNLTEDKSEDSLKTLQRWYSDIKLAHVDLNAATNLVNVLIRLIGQREHKIYGKPSAEAQLALVVLFEFVKQGTLNLLSKTKKRNLDQNCADFIFISTADSPFTNTRYIC